MAGDVWEKKRNVKVDIEYLPMENQLLHEIVSDGNGHSFAAIGRFEFL